MKKCNSCQILKSLSDFPKSRGNRSHCKICFNKRQKEWRLKNPDKFAVSQTKYRKKNQAKTTAKQKEWRKNNPDKAKNILIKSRHGITLEQYNLMLKEQNNMCKICSSEEKLYIDHDHKTMKIRGLLCNSCNKGLGLFYDSIESIERAIKYLEKNNEP